MLAISSINDNILNIKLLKCIQGYINKTINYSIPKEIERLIYLFCNDNFCLYIIGGRPGGFDECTDQVSILSEIECNNNIKTFKRLQNKQLPCPLESIGAIYLNNYIILFGGSIDIFFSSNDIFYLSFK
mmetsp:Transcript_50962/g.62404  ORF Transcript_50962/g.62404 Transcript_50962/m.62404 type:complete len:129 (+) Transcript_50962:426-812(+)